MNQHLSAGYSLYCGGKAALESTGKGLSIGLGDRSIRSTLARPDLLKLTKLPVSLTIAKLRVVGFYSADSEQPQDIADVVAFIASEDCCWIIGHTFQAGVGFFKQLFLSTVISHMSQI
jgi:3-oxoacyl-[acyl-carrier protein] reductase